MVSDWQVRETAQPGPNARMSEGKGSAKLVIHIGDVILNVRTPQGGVTRRVNHVFSGLHVGDYSAGVMADPARGEPAAGGDHYPRGKVRGPATPAVGTVSVRLRSIGVSHLRRKCHA